MAVRHLVQVWVQAQRLLPPLALTQWLRSPAAAVAAPLAEASRSSLDPPLAFLSAASPLQPPPAPPPLFCVVSCAISLTSTRNSGCPHDALRGQGSCPASTQELQHTLDTTGAKNSEPPSSATVMLAEVRRRMPCALGAELGSRGDATRYITR